MRILITGGAGFIGSTFVCQSLKDGHTIINIDKLTYAGRLENLGAFQHHPKHHFYPVDICDTSSLRTIFQDLRPDLVVHMAAESHVDRSIEASDTFVKTNINGTHTLLEVSRHYYQSHRPSLPHFKWIHLSTDEVFGSFEAPEQCQEGMPYRPSSPYAASKAASDLLVRSYHQTYGLPTVIVNASNNYGPRQYPEKLIPLMIMTALAQKPLPIYGEGQQVRDWLHVEDHVRALFALIHHGKIGETYCIGGGNEIKNIDLVDQLCVHLNEISPAAIDYRSLMTFVTDRPGHDFRYATNTKKIQQETGWAPQIDFEEGLKETVRWYIDERTGDFPLEKRRGLI